MHDLTPRTRLLDAPDSLALVLQDGASAMWRHLREGWERFVSDGTLPSRFRVRPLILERWNAARRDGLDPFAPEAPTKTEGDDLERILAEDAFVSAGRRVIHEMIDVLEGHAFLLADASGQILHAEGDCGIIDGLHRVNARPGGVWGEGVSGTNGIGTSLVFNRPAVVFGPEHFRECCHGWVCYGAPVRDPLSGDVLGIVDVSGVAERARVNHVPLVVSLAHSIEYLLADSARERRQRLLDALEAAEKRCPSNAVAVLDSAGNVLSANRRWRDFTARYADDARDLARSLASGTAEPAMRLPRSAARVASIESVRARGRDIGFVAVVEEARSKPSTTTNLEAPFEAIVGRDPSFRAALRMAARAARSNEPVLVCGETGTGKELVVSAIHRASARAEKPLVSLNCAALSRELVESELFGYEGGAFTGARREGKPGRFELANGGTLFLDEIGELAIDVQAKLLRVLEEQVVFRVGGVQPRPIDVRIVAASNRDLPREVARGGFRADLFYRLDVFQVFLPPLRERGDDVLELAKRFLDRLCESAGRPPPRMAPEVENALRRHPWPGNVRELRNTISRLVALLEGDEVTLEDLPVPPVSRASGAGGERPLDAMEDDLIRRALDQLGGNVTETARSLGIDRSTIYRRLRSGRVPRPVR